MGKQTSHKPACNCGICSHMKKQKSEDIRDKIGIISKPATFGNDLKGKGKYFSEECGESVETVNTIRNHMKQKHIFSKQWSYYQPVNGACNMGSTKNLSCDICKKYFNTEDTWKEHITHEHKRAEKIHCNICNKKIQ